MKAQRTPGSMQSVDGDPNRAKLATPQLLDERGRSTTRTSFARADRLGADLAAGRLPDIVALRERFPNPAALPEVVVQLAPLSTYVRGNRPVVYKTAIPVRN